MAEKDESIPTLVTASPPSEPETSECRLNEDEVFLQYFSFKIAKKYDYSPG
jgi:hypothetical protein